MSRIHRDARGASPFQRGARTALLLVNLAFFAWALWMGREAVSDGSGHITTGFVVAAGIAATTTIVGALAFLAFPARLIATLQIYVLGAQLLHSAGHLLRLYYTIWFYDDLLHFGLVFAIGLLALEMARARGFLFSFRMGSLQLGVLVWILATAAAGLWEIFEFTMDVLMGTREQDNLADTMIDMIDGTFGGALAGLVAWSEVRADRRAKALADAHSDELLD